MIEVRTTPAPIETVTPIKPSEAIRLGCLTTAPAIGTIQTTDGATCALGAMIVGFGGEPSGDILPWAYQDFRRGIELPTPDNLYDLMSPGGLVMYLNDAEKWPREQIADYLESLGL